MKQVKIGQMFKNISDKMKADADAELKMHGLTMGQSWVLKFLSSQGGCATQKEIELFLKVAHPTVVGIVSRMEQNGFVSCYLDERDRRIKHVSMTSKGIKIDQLTCIEMQKMDETLVQGFSSEEIDLLQQLLEKVYHNIE